MNDGHKMLELIRGWQAEKAARRKELRKWKDRERKREKRETKRAERETKESKRSRMLDREEAERAFKLEQTTKGSSSDRRLLQLRGRAAELAKFWRAGQEAEHELGRPPSDLELAKMFDELQGSLGKTSRHQARTRRLLITKLEAEGGVWGSE